MTNENSRAWLLENSALPLIEVMQGGPVTFMMDHAGNFFIHPGGYISDGSMCSGGVGDHGETCKATVDNWLEAVINLPEDEHWTSGPYEDARRFKVTRFQDSVVIAQMDPANA